MGSGGRGRLLLDRLSGALLIASDRFQKRGPAIPGAQRDVPDMVRGAAMYPGNLRVIAVEQPGVLANSWRFLHCLSLYVQADVPLKSRPILLKRGLVRKGERFWHQSQRRSETA